MGIRILDDEATYSGRRTRGEMKPYRRPIIVEVEVERPDSQSCEQFIDYVRETRE
jgi:hypothetical protein